MAGFLPSQLQNRTELGAFRTEITSNGWHPGNISGLEPVRTCFGSAHQMGTCRMSDKDPRHGAVDGQDGSTNTATYLILTDLFSGGWGLHESIQ